MHCWSFESVETVEGEEEKSRAKEKEARTRSQSATDSDSSGAFEVARAELSPSELLRGEKALIVDFAALVNPVAIMFLMLIDSVFVGDSLEVSFDLESSALIEVALKG